MTESRDSASPPIQRERCSLELQFRSGIDLTAISIVISGIACWISAPLAYVSGWV